MKLEKEDAVITEEPMTASHSIYGRLHNVHTETRDFFQAESFIAKLLHGLILILIPPYCFLKNYHVNDLIYYNKENI